MGLSISVGQLAFLRKEDEDGYGWLQEALREVNRLLAANGLPTHHEPENLPRLRSRYRHVGQPYSWLHYLRRAVAYALRGHSTLPDFPADEEPTKNLLYDEVLFSFESHLVCHSDCGGFYVPVDFPEPLYDELPDDDPRCVTGGILGSSQEQCASWSRWPLCSTSP